MLAELAESGGTVKKSDWGDAFLKDNGGLAIADIAMDATCNLAVDKMVENDQVELKGWAASRVRTLGVAIDLKGSRLEIEYPDP